MQQHEFNQFIQQKCSATITDPEVSLIDQGIDSLALLGLLVAIEDELGVELDPEALADGRLSTPSALHEYIEQATAGRS